jgi:5'-nucleotidase
MRILVTNDDGIDATGLHVLARRLTDLGEVVVAAPDREYSGAGAALGALHLLRPEVRRAQVDGVAEAWSVAGPPALCVTFARLGVFGDPFDLVVAGINPGANTGRAIYHSGTVGAALTARNGDMPGLAVSQAVVGFGVEGQGWDEMLVGQQWDTAAEVGAQVAAAMVKAPLADPPVINLNVPNCPLSEIRGWRRTDVARLPPRALARAELVPMEGHADAFDIEMHWGDPVELPVESDSGAVEAGYVSITALGRIVDDEEADLDVITGALDTTLPDTTAADQS